MCIGTTINKNLTGNLMILLAKECLPLYHTKLLKLLYLIDEESVKRTGTPITWLSYNVWQLGPVAEDVYFSKIDGYNKFSDFVRFDIVSDDKYIVHPVAPFDDSEFSNLDLQIINDVVKQYGKMNARQLVSKLHTDDSLWKKTKIQSGVRFAENNKTSAVTLNFADIISNDTMKKTMYYNAVENMELRSTLS